MQLVSDYSFLIYEWDWLMPCDKRIPSVYFWLKEASTAEKLSRLIQGPWDAALKERKRGVPGEFAPVLRY